MCKIPVTFGGGIAIEYPGFSALCCALKYPFSSHILYHLSSISFGE